MVSLFQEMWTLFFWLMCGHALADFALQSEAMAAGKNYNTPVDYAKIPPGQTPQTVWPYWLTAHALVHAGTVGVITQSPLVGFAEFLCHWVIDYAKCRGLTGIHYDQAIHASCKLWWVAWVVLY
jgi:hypothetical protein